MTDYYFLCPSCYLDMTYSEGPALGSVIKCDDCKIELKVFNVFNDLPSFNNLTSELLMDDYFRKKRAYLTSLKTDLENDESLGLILAKPVVQKFEAPDS